MCVFVWRGLSEGLSLLPWELIIGIMTGLNCRWPCEADGASQASICRGLMICFSMESFYFLGCGLNKRLCILYLKAIKAVICRIWPEFFLNELTLSIELEEQQCWSHVKGISVLCFRDIYWRYHATLASPIPSCLIIHCALPRGKSPIVGKTKWRNEPPKCQEMKYSCFYFPLWIDRIQNTPSEFKFHYFT